MEEGGDQDLFHTTPPAAPPSMVESSTTPMHIATPDCMVMNPQSAMKETPIKKFYISGRATRILEARKLEELKKRMQFEEKSTKLTNQRIFNEMKYGKHVIPSNGGFKKLKLYSSPSEPKPTATASIPSPEHNICLHGSKLLEKSDKPILPPTSSIPTPESTICVDASKFPVYSQEPITTATASIPNPVHTLCVDGSKFPDYSEEKFFNDVKQGVYQKGSMLALFQRTFDKGKPIISDEEENVGNIRSTSIAKTAEEVFATSPESFLDNPNLNIEYTDTLSNVCQLFSTFSGEKAKLLRIIGFSGLCAFPVHESIDLRFYVWILSKVDVSSSTLDLGNSRKIPIHDYDISLITGLPFNGHSVIREETSPLIKRSNASQIKKFLSVGNLDGRFTVPYVEHILRREYSSPMSELDRYGFCIAATVYAIASFLAVESGAVRFPFEIIDSLVDPLQIRSHNWSQLVRNSFITQAAYVQNQICSAKNIIKVGGCPMIAKVFYLDNIEFGDNLVPDYIFPRGSVFTQEIVDKLITMDTKINARTKKRLYGNHEFKSRYKVFYSRKTQAEPLYVVPIAVDNKRKRDNIDEQTALLEKEQAARIAAVNSKGRQLSVGQLIMKAEGKLFHRDERGKFKSNLSVRASSTGAVLDLNDGMDVIPTAAQQGDQPMVELSDPEDSIVRGQKTGIYKDPIGKCLIFYNSLKGTRTFNLACMNWFEHNQPTTIKISGETICDESSKGRQYGKDYSDAVTRMLTCDDDKNHIGSRKREKHYMAYSWACQAIRAKGMGGVRQYKEFFISDFYKYDVDKCNKIAATVETHGYHSCYIWDIIKKEVHVLDPVKMTCRCATIQKLHEPIVVDLSKCLILCLFEFFPECKLDGLDWKIIYRNDTSKRCKWQNSGLYALLYAQFYHGSPLGDRIDTTDLGHFRARHLWEVMLMDGNVGAMPLALTMYQNLGDDKAAI